MDVNETKKSTKIFLKIKKIVTIVVVVFVLVVVGILSIQHINNRNKIEVDSDLLIAKIVESSELTTAKIYYKGVLEYSGEGTAFIDKTEFLMVYEATARVGIDVSEVEVSVDNDEKIVYIVIPKAEIIDVKVDPTSIKYYNQKFKLLNFTDKEDANKAQFEAEKEAKKELESMGFIENADKQSAILIKGILDGAIPKDFVYEISYK